MNTAFILALIGKYANADKEINQDDFLELVEGLEEDEIESVLAILSKNGFKVIDESVNKTLFFDGSDLRGLTNEELCVLAQQGSKEAKDALIINNKNLVHKIAARVLKQYRPTGLDEEDLYIEGSIGLMTAVDKFDVSLGYKLSTYACNWIRQAITRAVMNDGYGMRLPVHMFEQVIRVNKCRKLHGANTIHELMEYVNSDYDTDYSYEDIQRLVMYADQYLNTTSLNKIANQDADADTEIIDFVAARDNVEDEVMSNVVAEEISKALESLSDKEHAVISMRFGLEGNDRMTLEEIGHMYNVTRERIRQIESTAIRKLSKPSQRRRLEGLYA
ncbi:RNA polymerase primary sigma factor [Butyrivibrio fibrisolvens DSM 3071]|uniref:RNA polymerase primary sigma factor n=1 Tax=Butyrivibrio fibrisolvens DSM 3071 TaxID=1121131 RepID=A0A1M5X114_BUTFI|nr:sigma-70 family RNA polymerase sigma factor [Butyrivibrio fibrisolvens]SHH93134.1 RNA polymerase primary sigma factor [Butyrivibrio fibrisolvens DSM 3071]